jgi:hypothetical protein
MNPVRDFDYTVRGLSVKCVSTSVAHTPAEIAQAHHASHVVRQRLEADGWKLGKPLKANRIEKEPWGDATGWTLTLNGGIAFQETYFRSER